MNRREEEKTMTPREAKLVRAYGKAYRAILDHVRESERVMVDILDQAFEVAISAVESTHLDPPEVIEGDDHEERFSYGPIDVRVTPPAAGSVERMRALAKDLPVVFLRAREMVSR